MAHGLRSAQLSVPALGFGLTLFLLAETSHEQGDVAYSSCDTIDFARSAMSRTTSALASDVTSPSWRCSETSRSNRRMILPLRVFGSSSVKTMDAGRAILPIFFAT